MAHSRVSVWQTLPCSEGPEECPSSHQSLFQFGELRIWWPRGGGRTGRGGEVWLSLGPRSQRQGRRVWLPTCPGPQPQALQPPGPPRPPSWPAAPGWDASPHFPEESERGLGRTQSLEVGQMLLGRSWGPRAGRAQVGHGLQLTPQGTRLCPHGQEPTTPCWVP